ncbi:hypothetical protein H2200_003370 [Cladophialophora chaetospira]|uniref:Uncharacterized protein n=1 Tax=Cladophialophora chaetospira TaxID=386627 RepID=A0AA39CMP0_9EURO|nr:hypothetical protein H2200_003370 [Cladophialophora chaetospira]
MANEKVKRSVFIPVSGFFIMFLLRTAAEDKVEIQWSEGGRERTETYYRIECWFGTLKEDKESIEALGKTLIFVAHEYIDADFAKLPILKENHLTTSSLNLSKDPSSYGIFQLNHRFHYGTNGVFVNKKPTWVWIVYHPALGGGTTPKTFQHRFVRSPVIKNADSLLKSIKKAKDPFTRGFLGNVVGSLALKLSAKLATGMGHELNSFEDPVQPDGQELLDTSRVELEVQDPKQEELELLKVEAVQVQIEQFMSNTMESPDLSLEEKARRQEGLRGRIENFPNVYDHQALDEWLTSQSVWLTGLDEESVRSPSQKEGANPENSGPKNGVHIGLPFTRATQSFPK